MDWGAIASILAERSDRPIVLLDKQGKIRLFNRAMEQVLGWTRFQIEGKPWADTCAPSDQQASSRRWITEALRGSLRSYETIGVTSTDERIAFRFEFSLIGRGSAQGLLITATQAIAVQSVIGPLEGQDLEYEVATNETNFGTLSQIAARGEFLRLPQHDARCFMVIHGVAQPCENCPLLLGDDSPWPRISVKHRGSSGDAPKFYEVKTAEKLNDAQARVRIQLLPEQALDAIHAAKVDQLAACAALSPREREVLSYLLLGRNVDDIAHCIGIAVRTVKYHQANVLAKLGADSRADLMRLLF
ncbi:MAG: narP1 [Deltaproteobacteria bacterium]|nr:narP1 [Deltaproteobacteria bacterium]